MTKDSSNTKYINLKRNIGFYDYLGFAYPSRMVLMERDGWNIAEKYAEKDTYLLSRKTSRKVFQRTLRRLTANIPAYLGTST